MLQHYSDENIADIIIKIVYDNNTAIDALAFQIGFNPKKRHLYYIGHVINLVAKAILFDTDIDPLQDQIE
ncbi:MAG: hypothetical protein M1839_008309 [Geoglossum umbratile]|nr:MAG: hypothetical protein M1839_008309 [Geoglossum umbratile]